MNLRGTPRGTSAPSSPAKSRESLLQRVQSLTGAARDQGASILGNLIIKNIMDLYLNLIQSFLQAQRFKVPQDHHLTKIDRSLYWLSMTRTQIGPSISAERNCTTIMILGLNKQNSR